MWRSTAVQSGLLRASIEARVVARRVQNRRLGRPLPVRNGGVIGLTTHRCLSEVIGLRRGSSAAEVGDEERNHGDEIQLADQRFEDGQHSAQPAGSGEIAVPNGR